MRQMQQDARDVKSMSNDSLNGGETRPPKPQGPKVGPPEDHTSWSSGTEEAEIAAADDVARLVTKEDV